MKRLIIISLMLLAVGCNKPVAVIKDVPQVAGDATTTEQVEQTIDTPNITPTPKIKKIIPQATPPTPTAIPVPKVQTISISPPSSDQIARIKRVCALSSELQIFCSKPDFFTGYYNNLAFRNSVDQLFAKFEFTQPVASANTTQTYVPPYTPPTFPTINYSIPQPTYIPVPTITPIPVQPVQTLQQNAYDAATCASIGWHYSYGLGCNP